VRIPAASAKVSANEANYRCRRHTWVLRESQTVMCSHARRMCSWWRLWAWCEDLAVNMACCPAPGHTGRRSSKTGMLCWRPAMLLRCSRVLRPVRLPTSAMSAILRFCACPAPAVLPVRLPTLTYDSLRPGAGAQGSQPERSLALPRARGRGRRGRPKPSSLQLAPPPTRLGQFPWLHPRLLTAPPLSRRRLSRRRSLLRNERLQASGWQGA
jgi:hypothetical protein